MEALETFCTWLCEADIDLGDLVDEARRSITSADPETRMALEKFLQVYESHTTEE